MDQYPDPAALWLLLHAFGEMQRSRDGAPIREMDVLADVAELPFSQLARLIATGIHAGWIEEGEDGALGLTAAGWAAIRRERERRGEGRFDLTICTQVFP